MRHEDERQLHGPAITPGTGKMQLHLHAASGRLGVSLAAGLLLTLGLAATPAAALECPESGQMFGQMHIVPAAHAGLLGSGSNPGMHRGYSACVARSD